MNSNSIVRPLPLAFATAALLVFGCQPADVPPQVVRVEAPAPALAPAPAAVQAEPELLMQSYPLPAGDDDRTFSAIRELLGGGDNPVGRVSRGPRNTVVIVAPAGIHKGVVTLLEGIEASPPEKKLASIEMNYWLVAGKAHQDGAESTIVPGLEATLEEVRQAQGRPMDFELIEHLSVLSFEEERATTNGRDSFVNQRLDLIDGAVLADLKIGTREGQNVETRVRLAPDRTLVFGMVGMEPELRKNRGLELGATKEDVTLYFIVKAHVLTP